MYDASEKQAIRHSVDGFCQVIGCPECEVRRQERFGRKELAPGKSAAVRSEVEVLNGLYQGQVADNDQLQARVEQLESALADRLVALEETQGLAMRYLDLVLTIRKGIRAHVDDQCRANNVLFAAASDQSVSDEQVAYLTALAWNAWHKQGHSLLDL